MSGSTVKKDLILGSATELFATQGIDETSVSQIMERAGLAKGTFYLYFMSKEQVIEEAFWNCHRMDAEACAEGLEEIENCVDKLKRRGRNAILWAVANPVEAKLERMYYHYKNLRGQGIYKKQFLHYQVVNSIIEEGLAKKEYKPLPADLLGEMFFAGAATVLYYYYDYPFSLEEGLLDTYLDAVISGLRA